MIHFVYIIESEADGTFYIGVSSDPEKRLGKHNLPHKYSLFEIPPSNKKFFFLRLFLSLP
ncbi:GIY-YIG nuclease family protein [Cecembia calidifontis]|uniref:GIY-YIG nuclease family protein n=1 Tax=Cecembia calidifontis TaxID=1187080 RepID=UPI00102A0739|nr:GIY-YIG nuclease family protein [Cecembia calidifontis]